MLALRKSASFLTVALLAGCASLQLPSSKPADLYKQGDDLYASKHYDDAIAQYKKVRDAYASTELSSSAELRIADAYYDSERYIESFAAYSDFRKLHPVHQKAPYALYRMGLSSFNQITGIDRDQTPQKNTATYFEDFLNRYPTSEYAADARAKLDSVRMMQLEYELYVAKFYYRAEKYNAAGKRLEDALVAFPKNPLHDQTLFLLGASRLKSGSPDKAKEAFNTLAADFPNSTFNVEAGKLLKKYY